jgi:hypothetical protein
MEGTAADWWDAYTAAHDNPDTINWQEFRSKFREQHIPKGLMKLKKQEFLALKQGTMSVSEYRDKFIQLSCPLQMSQMMRRSRIILGRV